MARMITKAVHKSLQKQLVLSLKDKAKVRRASLRAIAAARAEGHRGRLILAREDQCGAYMNARHDVAQRRAQLRDIHVLS